jgi:hypothetical protein
MISFLSTKQCIILYFLAPRELLQCPGIVPNSSLLAYIMHSNLSMIHHDDWIPLWMQFVLLEFMTEFPSVDTEIFIYCTYINHLLALYMVGRARHLCRIAWFAAKWANQRKKLPIMTVQNVWRTNGLGSKLFGNLNNVKHLL